jgi:hypothetical protein
MDKVTCSPLLALVVLLGVASGAAAQSTALPPTRPNIVWISTEDMSPRLGAYGDALARTPTLDRLAKQALRFTNAFTTAPVCAPSRAAIITGMHQNAIGAQHMRTIENRVPELPGSHGVPPFHVKAFPEYLRAAGYFTSNRAKTDYQFGEPFTIWDDQGPKAHWRNRPDKSQPFFSVFNINVTHESQIFPSSPARKSKPLVTDPAKVQVPPYYPDTPLVREERARVYDNIADDGRRSTKSLQLKRTACHRRLPCSLERPRRQDARAKRSALRFRSARAADDSGNGLGSGVVSDRLVSFVDPAPTVLALAGVEIPGHVHGRVLVGGKSAPEPNYVFAARDRMDIEYDMMRSARDKRFLYIRNFQPELPYAGHIIYRNQSNIMQEWFRLQAAGKLTGPAALWMRTSRPAEELYDTHADPHQIDNLAARPAHRATVERMRRAVSDWMARTGDQGVINEAEMIQRMWPGGVQPETARPYIVPRRTTDAPTVQKPGRSRSVEVVIYVPTQGASIGYSTDEGPNPRWRLYTGPILVDRPMTLRAKAIRYGYKESAETRTVFRRSAEL